MERNGAMLRAIFAGIEPIIIGLVTGWQWLVLLGLCNLFIIILRHNNEHSQSKQNPLSHNMFSYKSQLQNLRTQNNYFGAISFLSIISGIVAYLAGKGDIYTKIALALMVTGIVYWIIAAATHGFKHTRAQVISKIFAALLLVSTGRAYLGSTSGQAFIADIPDQILKIITIPKAMAPSSSSNVKVQDPFGGTGSNNTGDQTGNTGKNEETAETTNEKSVEPTTETQVETTKDSTIPLTFAQVVPALVEKFALPIPNGSINFTNIAPTSNIYNAFKAGYSARFFGPSINPSTTVSCNVYFVMLGLAQKWNVSYNPSTIFSAYRAVAEQKGQLYGCESGKFVTEANLP